MKGCQLDRDYLKTIPFYLKIVEMVCSIAVWICVGSRAQFALYGGGGFINFCATMTFVATLLLFFLYLFAKIQVIPGPWILIVKPFYFPNFF